MRRPFHTPPRTDSTCACVCIVPLVYIRTCVPPSYACIHPSCLPACPPACPPWRRAVKKANRSSCASCAVAAGAVGAAEVRGADSLAAVAASAAAAAAAAGGNSHRVAFFRGVQSPRRQQQGGRRAATVAREVEGSGGGRAVPFVATGRGEGSYNVVSAVSKAMRTARRGRPREVREIGRESFGRLLCAVVVVGMGQAREERRCPCREYPPSQTRMMRSHHRCHRHLADSAFFLEPDCHAVPRGDNTAAV